MLKDALYGLRVQPNVHQSIALVWSLAFESLLDFCSKRLAMIITAFNAIFFSGEPLIHASINLVVSSIKHLSPIPVGKRKILFFQ